MKTGRSISGRSEGETSPLGIQAAIIPSALDTPYPQIAQCRRRPVARQEVMQETRKDKKSDNGSFASSSTLVKKGKFEIFGVHGKGQATAMGVADHRPVT